MQYHIQKWKLFSGVLIWPILSRFYTTLAEKIIASRAKEGGSSDDILGIMTKAKDNNPYMTDRIIARTILQFFTDG